MSNKPYRPPAKVPTQQGGSVLAVSHGQVWQGPLPPPEELEAFNKAVPGLAETIVEMAKQEAEHPGLQRIRDEDGGSHSDEGDDAD